MSTMTKKTPKKRTGTRRSHIKAVKIITQTCENCKASIVPHRACKSCGMYKKRNIVKTTVRATRRLRRTKKIS